MRRPPLPRTANGTRPFHRSALGWMTFALREVAATTRVAHDPRVVQTISIASPFLGIDVADLFPDRLREIVLPPNAQLARIVTEAPHHLPRVPHLSIVAERDQLVHPAARGILPGAPSFVL